MALLQLTILPIGTPTVSLGDYIVAIQKQLSVMGATFALNDMGTLIEGEPKELLGLVASLYEIPFEEGAMRVVTQITIDDRRDKKIKIGDKIQSVINKTASSELTNND